MQGQRGKVNKIIRNFVDIEVVWNAFENTLISFLISKVRINSFV